MNHNIQVIDVGLIRLEVRESEMKAKLDDF
jgi:hypothetical protein